MFALAAAVITSGAGFVIAQQPTAEPQFRLTPERLQARLQAIEQDLDYIPGEVIVKFEPGAGPAQQARALSVARGPIATSDQQWIGDALLVHAAGEPDAERFAARLRAQPEVVYAHPNYLSRLQSVPNDPFYRDQWHFDLINMPAAWDINPGGSPDVIVAVIDSGVTERNTSYNWRLWTGRAFGVFNVPYAINPDLTASQFLPGRDFVFFGAGSPVLDMVGHGTHVAGTILQTTDNALGFAGIAHRSRLLPLKVCFGYWEAQIILGDVLQPGYFPPDFGTCDTAATAAAIRYAADQGAKVINLSLGGTNRAQVQLDAMRYAVQRGAFLAIAAGNEFEAGNPASYPAAFAPELDGAMGVGAVGPTMRRAYYSNSGSYVEIAAPGGDDRVGGSRGLIYQAGLSRSGLSPAQAAPRFNEYVVYPDAGTSMAAPHVAGLAALLYSQGITNPAAIEAAIKRFAVDLGPAGRDSEYGFGLIDARATLRGMGVAR